MMLRFPSAMVLVCGVLMLFCVGCGGGDGHPDTVAVSGTVTLDGTPLEGAMVSFSPQGTGHAASGTTDASGAFQLTSFSSSDGAVPGSYKVAIMKTEAAADPAAGETDMDAAYKAAEESGVDLTTGQSAATRQPAAQLIPLTYTNPELSGLTAEVTAEGGNTFTFELKSQ